MNRESLVCVARKCRQQIANRYRTAEAFVRMRKEIYDLKAQVHELSQSHLLAEMHWMKSEIEAFRQLQSRIPAIETELSERRAAVDKKARETESAIRDGIQVGTDAAQRQIEYLRVLADKDRKRHLKEVDCEIERRERMEPAWVLGFSVPLSSDDPIYSLRLQ